MTFVADRTAHAEMRVLCSYLLVDEISLVHLFRLNWRRRPRSPLPLGGAHGRRLVEPLHDRIAGVAHQTTAFDGGNGRRGMKGKQQQKGKEQGKFRLHQEPLGRWYCVR